MADEKPSAVDRPLESRIVRSLLPLGLDMAMAAGGAPPIARYLALPALQAGLIAYDAPPGEKLLRAVLEGGGGFAGAHLARAAHGPVTKPLHGAVIRELRRPPADSTFGGRMALLAVSPVGRAIMGVTGAQQGRKAGRALADRIAKRKKDKGDDTSKQRRAR